MPTHKSPIRPVIVVVLVVLASVGGGFTSAATATEAVPNSQKPASGPAVTVSDVAVENGSEATATIWLSEAPDGLAGFVIEVSSQNDSVATISNAAVDPAFGLRNATVQSGTARLAASDTDDAIGTNETAVTVGTVTVEGNANGKTNLSVSVSRIDDDGGDPISVRKRIGGVTVVDRPTAVPSIEVTDAITAPKTATTVALRLSEASNGLAGFVIEVTTDNDSVVSVTDAAVDTTFGLRNASVQNGIATLAASDTRSAVESGTTGIVLGNVTIEGATESSANLSVTPVRIDADSGVPIPTLAGIATVTVASNSSSGPTIPGAAGPAQDTDGDGQYEDVNGDGQTDVIDVLAYYNNRKRDVIRNNTAALDFDGDGAAGTVFDAVALYEEIS